MLEGERRQGAPLRFVFRDGEGPAVDGAMIAYDPPARLERRWDDGETLRFDLRPDGYQLDGEQPPWTPVQRSRQVHESYVERFGPQAATIAPPDAT
jgi:hypothetical protein